ncbi:MAG: hypothetical protein LBQ40_00060 [Clostridiales bacterium]|nr:hypothetical protein [Clostridiales bacterium]
MNKKFKAIILAVFTLIFTFVLAACNFDKVKPDEPEDPEEPTAEEPVVSKAYKTEAYDYYDDTFGVGRDHVFQTLVYNDLINLISDNATDASRPASSVNKPDGDYAVLFGGAWDDGTKAVIKTINAEAKAKNITVYFFDPYLDGKLSQDVIKDVAGGDGLIAEGENSGRVGYNYGGTDFVYDDFNIKDYIYQSVSLLARINRSFTEGAALTADNDTTVITPLLVTVHREQANESNGNTTVSKISGRVESPFIGKAGGYTLSTGESNAYANAVNSLLTNGIIKNVRYDPFLTISSPTVHSGGNNTHLTTNSYFKTVSYAELIALLEAPGERFIFFGGTWCPNTAAIYNAIQTAATNAGYDAPIYLYDPIITAVSGRPNTRNNETAANASNSGTHSVLYANLLENYFDNFVSRWNNADSASQKAFGATGAATWFSINGKQYTKICVPNLILYNKAVGIIDSFESELTWNTGSQKGGTGNVSNEGVAPAELPFAYTYAANVFADLFAKAGLSEAFLQLGGTFVSDVKSDVRRTVITATAQGSTIRISTYYNSADYNQAVSVLESSGVTVVKLNTFSFYVAVGGNAKKIFDGVKSGAIYTAGVILDAAAEQASDGGGNNAAGNNGGGNNGAGAGGNGGNGAGTSEGGGDDELC